MEIPKIFIKENRIYYFVELCKNFARYKTRKGIYECFSFFELGLVEEKVKPFKKQYNEGRMKFVKYGI